MPPQENPADNNSEQLLEHILENQNTLGTEGNDIAEKNLEQNAKNGEALETGNDMVAEGFGKVLEEMKGPKDIRIIPPTDDENALSKMFWEMLRGRTGPQGERGEKGDQGEKGEDSTVAGPMGPQGPQGVQGEKGKDGKDGKNGENGKDGRDGKDGKNGKDGKDGKDGKSPSFKDIWEKFKEKIEKFIDKKHDDTIQATRSIIASKTYSYKEMDDVNYPESSLDGGEPAQDAVMKYNRTTHKWEPGTDNNSGGSGGGFTYINEVVSGSGTSFVLAHTPANAANVVLHGGGSRLTPTADFSISGANITMVNSYDAGQVLADYS